MAYVSQQKCAKSINTNNVFQPLDPYEAPGFLMPSTYEAVAIADRRVVSCRAGFRVLRVSARE